MKYKTAHCARFRSYIAILLSSILLANHAQGKIDKGPWQKVPGYPKLSIRYWTPTSQPYSKEGYMLNVNDGVYCWRAEIRSSYETKIVVYGTHEEKLANRWDPARMTIKPGEIGRWSFQRKNRNSSTEVSVSLDFKDPKINPRYPKSPGKSGSGSGSKNPGVDVLRFDKKKDSQKPKRDLTPEERRERIKKYGTDAIRFEKKKKKKDLKAPASGATPENRKEKNGTNTSRTGVEKGGKEYAEGTAKDVELMRSVKFYSSRTEHIQKLLDEGANVNARVTQYQRTEGKIRAYHGETPLTLAARHVNPEQVRFLLAAGADPNLIYYDDYAKCHRTALDAAIYTQRRSPDHPKLKEVIQILRAVTTK